MNCKVTANLDGSLRYRLQSARGSRVRIETFLWGGKFSTQILIIFKAPFKKHSGVETVKRCTRPGCLNQHDLDVHATCVGVFMKIRNCFGLREGLGAVDLLACA